MENIKDGGSAFPVYPIADNRTQPKESQFGMSLRDYFAAKAMEGCLASCPAGIGWHDPKGLPLEAWANTSYRMADAMLKERSK